MPGLLTLNVHQHVAEGRKRGLDHVQTQNQPMVEKNALGRRRTQDNVAKILAQVSL